MRLWQYHQLQTTTFDFGKRFISIGTRKPMVIQSNGQELGVSHKNDIVRKVLIKTTKFIILRYLLEHTSLWVFITQQNRL